MLLIQFTYIDIDLTNLASESMRRHENLWVLSREPKYTGARRSISEYSVEAVDSEDCFLTCIFWTKLNSFELNWCPKFFVFLGMIWFRKNSNCRIWYIKDRVLFIYCTTNSSLPVRKNKTISIAMNKRSFPAFLSDKDWQKIHSEDGSGICDKCKKWPIF